MEELIKSVQNWLHNDSFGYFLDKFIGDNLPSFAAGALLKFIKVIYHISKLIFAFSIIYPLLWLAAIALYLRKKQTLSKEIQDLAQLTLIVFEVQYFFSSYYKEHIQGKFKLING